MPDVEIEGLKALHRDIEHLTKSMSPQQIEKASMKSADIIKREIKGRAPKGPTGNLKRSIVKKALDRKPYGASAIAAVDRKIAPHAHFVEFGTSHSEANPFFRKGVKASAGLAARKFRKELENMVDKAVKK